ncbi:electron transfer flavoprotein subunit alpha/FixB family protein [Breoghania sp.]|uniref:electron transfer flavoprotein subunit alpha/FixB family protein n=1 Tax=Breoghania sp. TaxID=2065378 RepID=UPI002AA8D9BE|nr:electron transfer flavoprotein subunit alpha/FixB family protein [Breoghania sp.]
MRKRRDPRAEQAARLLPGGPRPRYGLKVVATETDRPRRNPRAERKAATVSESPRLRIAWKGGVAPQAGTLDAPASRGAPKVRIIAEPAFHVLVIAGAGEIDRQMIGAARLIADAGGGAVCIASSTEAEDWADAGADRLMPLSGLEVGTYDPEAHAAAVLAAIASLKPAHVLFPETPGGGDIARRVAARLGERLFAGVEDIRDGRAIRRANGGRDAMSVAVPRLLSIAAGAFARHEGAPHEARRIEGPGFEPVRKGIMQAKAMPVDPDSIALAEADFLLSGGNGVSDWDAFAELAVLLGATRGGSRVVCDQGHLPRDRQVGASGTLVTAGCYFALGISGAPQHLQGIQRVGRVVAVNTDLHAAMIKRADLAIVADAQEVMPALIRLLAQRKDTAE